MESGEDSVIPGLKQRSNQLGSLHKGHTLATFGSFDSQANGDM